MTIIIVLGKEVSADVHDKNAFTQKDAKEKKAIIT